MNKPRKVQHRRGSRRLSPAGGVWLLALAAAACGARSGLEFGDSPGVAGESGGASSGTSGGTHSGGAGAAPTSGVGGNGSEIGGAMSGAGRGGASSGGQGGAGRGGISSGGQGDAGAGGDAGSTSECPPGTVSTPMNPRCRPLRATGVDAEAEHTCVLFEDGSLKCWGSGGALAYGNKQNVIAPASVGLVSVTTAAGLVVKRLGGGRSQSCPVLSDGSVKCWGEGLYGQLGYGNTNDIGDDELPSSVNSVSITSRPGLTASAVIGGDLHTCALLSDGSVQCWGGRCCIGAGAGFGGGSGIGDDELPSVIGPVSLSATAGVKTTALAADGAHSCALLSDGSVSCWGISGQGELGYGNTDTVGVSEPPSAVGPVSVSATPGLKVVQLAAGYIHTCALLSNGSVQCWGWNFAGQLGYGNTKNIGDDELPSSVGPVSITTKPGVTAKAIAAGGRHTCALLTDDSVQCWGDNSFGQLGYGNTNHIGDNELPSSVGPVSVTSTAGVTVKQLSLGDYHTCALLSDGTVKCWGWNHYGQLGNGNTDDIGDDELPSSRPSIVMF